MGIFVLLALRDTHVQKGPLADNLLILSEAMTLSGLPVENTDLERLENGDQALAKRWG